MYNARLVEVKNESIYLYIKFLNSQSLYVRLSSCSIVIIFTHFLLCTLSLSEIRELMLLNMFV